MAFTTTEFQKPPQPRWVLPTMAGLVVVLIGVAATIAVMRGGGSSSDGPPPGAVASPAPPVEPHGFSDIQWSRVGPVELPFSRQFGPAVISRYQASGYDPSECGAVIAAWQIPLRLVTTNNAEAILATQVVGDESRKNQVRQAIGYFQAAGPASQPLLATRPSAYRIVEYDVRHAIVDYALKTPVGPFLVTRYTVVRVDGDWKYQPFAAPEPHSPITALDGFVAF